MFNNIKAMTERLASRLSVRVMSGSLTLPLTCAVWQITVWKSKASRQNVEPQVLALASWETLAKALDLTWLHHSVIYKVIFFPQIHKRQQFIDVHV